MVAMPDPSTFRVLPWRPEEQGVARMFCDVLTPERTPYEGDPRHVLRRALQRAESLGLRALRRRRRARVLPLPRQQETPSRSTRAATSTSRRSTPAPTSAARPSSRSSSSASASDLSHHEGGPSQHEIDLRHGDALKIADDVMTCRITVKELALKYGWHATFMPKPLYGVNGSGHAHPHDARSGTGRTRSSTPTTRTSCPTSRRPSSPASCATRASCPRSSPSG